MNNFQFKTPLAETTFRNKYAQGPDDTWPKLAVRLVDDVCGTRNGTLQPLMSESDRKELVQLITQMKFIPGGRYLYYAGRPLHFYNNCFALKGEEDTREEWGNLLKRASDCLMSGGGIGIDYSIFRSRGLVLNRTGGTSSGPIPLMNSINEVGRNVMQGGSRRSAIFASLNWQHGDIEEFIRAKDWSPEVKALKDKDFNFPAPLDMTNISVNWDTKFIEQIRPPNLSGIPKLWNDVVSQMVKTGEPGMCFNFYENEHDTLRNACTEFTSEDDSDCCNLGSINLGNIENISELSDVVELGSKFLICGSIRGDLPYDKVKIIRERNRKIGLGLMGIHEWLIKRGYQYEVVDELKQWLDVYKQISKFAADEHCDRFYLSRPKKYRAIAPAGTIGIIAATTTGIEPIYAIAYKRRYLEGGDRWKYQYVVEPTAEHLINTYSVAPESIETARSLAVDVERRVKFQADIQDYVDMGISSTINMPAWGTAYNNESTVKNVSDVILRYAPRLRGITCYPDGARGGQPLTEIEYSEAIKHKGVIRDEVEEICKGGVCGI